MSYKQIALREETETIINLDYTDKKIHIWTNRASVMNRLKRKGYNPVKTTIIDDKVWGADYEFPISMVTKFIRGDIFNFNSNEE